MRPGLFSNLFPSFLSRISVITNVAICVANFLGRPDAHSLVEC